MALWFSKIMGGPSKLPNSIAMRGMTTSPKGMWKKTQLLPRSSTYRSYIAIYANRPEFFYSC